MVLNYLDIRERDINQKKQEDVSILVNQYPKDQKKLIAEQYLVIGS